MRHPEGFHPDTAERNQPSGSSYGDQIDLDEQRLQRELVARLDALDARRAARQRHAGLSSGSDPDFDNAANWVDGFHADGSLEYEISEADLHETPVGGRQIASPIHRIAVRSSVALTTLMCAGAVAVLFLAPLVDKPVEASADNTVPSAKTDALASASAGLVETTIVPLPIGGPPDNIIADPDNIIADDAPNRVIQISPEDGVTSLPQRDAQLANTAPDTLLARTAPVNAPVEPAFVNLEPILAKANVTRSDELQALAFAPTADTAFAEPAAEPDSASGGLETPRRSTQTARATTHVNMRTGPDITEPVITVVPAEAPFEVVECKAWCEVVFEGRKGWIYKGFVEQSSAAAISSRG